jgi:imidazolonepropionase-like amidohydrolase
MRSIVKIFFGCLLLVTFCASQTEVRAQTSKATLFEGARLIIGDGSPPIENSAFLVENGKFTQVGKKGEIKLPAGGVRVDLTGKTVIPGLIDAHTHMGWARYDNWTNIKSTDGTLNYTRENLIEQLHRAAYMGLSAIWSAGTDIAPLCYQVRDDALAGKIQNVVRYVPSGPAFTSADTVNLATQRTGAYITSSPEAVRKDVDESYANKVKVLKAWVAAQKPGEMPASDGVIRSSKEPMDPAVYKAFIDQAHKHNMRVLVHVGTPELPGLIQAGVDGIAHMVTRPTPEVLAMLKERGPKMFMTLTIRECPTCEADKEPDPLLVDTTPPGPLKAMLQEDQKPLSPEDLARSLMVPVDKLGQVQQNWEDKKKLIQDYIAMGIRIGVGSDSDHLESRAVWGNPPRLIEERHLLAWATHKEMEAMVAAGMKPSDVIVAATKTNAEWLGLDDLGTIAPRKTASFDVLDANPLDDIRNTRRINAVYLGGTKVDRAGLKVAFAKSFSNYSATK